MNGRLYDPLLRRFLAPDNYVQDPYNTQNFNRYGYVLNNPLLYSDPSGEWVHIVLGALIGGVVNVVMNWDNIDGFWDGLTTFAVGAGAGAVTAATGGAGAGFWATAGVGAGSSAVVSGSNSIVAQTGKNFSGFGDISWGDVVQNAFIGGVAGFAGASAGYFAANSSFLVNGVNSPVLRTVATAPVASAAGHVAGGTTAGLLEGQSLGNSFGGSFEGIEKSIGWGTAIGVATTVGVSYANGVSPWTGQVAKGVGKFEFPGNNPAKAPKGFEWKGKPGSTPGSKDGNWYNPKTGESLRPDLNHQNPIGPHWDYKDPYGKWFRIFPDGSIIPK